MDTPKEKREKLIVVGASGSGKDFLLRALINKGLRYSPKYTTRPKRSLEEDGREYNFISEDQFKQMIDKNEFYEYETFLTWFYGISREDFKNNQVFIMTPTAINKIDPIDRKNCFIVYLDIDRKTREERLF